MKKRLHLLFDFYNRTHCKNNTSLTFDDIQNHITTFNLTVWMTFNRDFGFFKRIKKDQIHGIFKKYSEKQLMSF